ncbi:MAG: cell wall hydrolase [Bdellovibrionales bacterium]
MKLILYFVGVIIFSQIVSAETRVVNPDGTTTITYEEGELEALRAAREAREQEALRQRILDRQQGAALSNQGGSVTRIIESDCVETTISRGTLKRCAQTAGGIHGDSNVYYLNGVEYDGLVVEENGGYRLYDKGEITQFTDEEVRGTTIREQDVPDTINCGNPQRRSKYQCLVCNCFHEARGQTFEEQVLVNRVVLSRVLSPSHPSNACDVVYERAQFSWTSENQVDANNSNSVAKTSIVLDENSSQFNQYYPNDKNALRSCRRSSLESLKYEDEFFAAYYVEKTTNTPPWLKTCKERSRSGETAVTPEENRISSENLAHNFYKICERREGRCLVYPTCSLAPRTSPVPRPRPPGVSNRALE